MPTSLFSVPPCGEPGDIFVDSCMTQPAKEHEQMTSGGFCSHCCALQRCTHFTQVACCNACSKIVFLRFLVMETEATAIPNPDDTSWLHTNPISSPFQLHLGRRHRVHPPATPPAQKSVIARRTLYRRPSSSPSRINADTEASIFTPPRNRSTSFTCNSPLFSPVCSSPSFSSPDSVASPPPSTPGYSRSPLLEGSAFSTPPQNVRSPLFRFQTPSKAPPVRPLAWQHLGASLFCDSPCFMRCNLLLPLQWQIAFVAATSG